MREAAFVIQGTYSAWMDVLSGKGAPLVMLTNGRLKLKKGALLGLLPHTRSAAELVRCAQRVPYE
jgi:putative sterol carrier protein